MDIQFKVGDVVRVEARPNPMAKGFMLAGYRGTVIDIDDLKGQVGIREFETYSFRTAPIEFVTFGSGKSKAEKDSVSAKGKEAREQAAQCACGCEAMTKGGGFLPGHDAKLSGAFKRIAKGKGTPEDMAKLNNPLVFEHPRVRSSAYLMFHLEQAYNAIKGSEDGQEGS